ncbi:ATP-binding cassette sub-family B member 10, mitochondrial, partial [Araneus ventricosus]
MWFQILHSNLFRNSLLTAYRKNISSNYSLLLKNSSKKHNINRNTYFPIILNANTKRCFPRLLSNVPKKPVRKELRRILKIAESQKWKLTGAIVLLFISSTVTMAVPFCVGKLIDMMTSSGDDLKTSLLSFCKVLVVIFIVGALANFGRVYLINISSHQVTNTLRRKVYGSILCQEAAFFDQTKTGELINRISADTTTVGMSITNNISDGLRYSFIFTAASCLMVYTSPLLASVSLTIVAPIAIAGAIAGKVLKRNSKSVQDALADATQVCEERISNIRTVQAFAKLREENEIYSQKINNVLHFAYKESLGRALFFGM